MLSDEGVRADLVARRITQVGRIGTRQVTTCARLALVGAACGKAGSMEGIHFGGSGGRKADRHAVAGGRFTIARTGDDESRLFATEKYPSVVERTEVLDAKSTQSGVVERDRLLKVGSADKMCEKMPSPEMTGVDMINFLGGWC